MDKIIYLIRHGLPDFEDGVMRCIGADTDLSLSEEGVRQAENLKDALTGIPVYTSPLKRAEQTARRASDLPPVILDGVREMKLGEFEGLTFEEIARRFPEVYAKRGEDWSYPPPRAEEYSEAQERAERALDSIKESEAAVVCHDGIIRALLVKYGGLNPKKDKMPRQPYGSISVLKRSGDSVKFTAAGRLPQDLPSEEEINEIRELCGVTDDIAAHMDAAAKKTAELCGKLNEKGMNLNQNLAVTAARLHDVCRPMGRVHPKAARDLLAERGYLTLGNVIAKHHDIQADGDIDEAVVLYLADKLTDGAKEVTLHSRFSKSRDKCDTKEAVLNHEKRYKAALEIERKINSVIKEEAN